MERFSREKSRIFQKILEKFKNINNLTEYEAKYTVYRNIRKKLERFYRGK